MIQKTIILMSILSVISCNKTSKEEGVDKYKDQFLKLAEFNCEGVTSDYYVSARIDNMDYCKNTNDSVKSVLQLFNNFTTSGPSTGGTIIGTPYNSIWFGIYVPFEKTDRIKHLYFESDRYSDTATMEEIATDVFVEGKRWPISGKNVIGKTVNCFYRFSDFRPGFNTFHIVGSQFGNQNNNYLEIKKVTIERFENYILYDVDLAFEAELYMSDLSIEADNLWAELRDGKMKALFKVPI